MTANAFAPAFARARRSGGLRTLATQNAPPRGWQTPDVEH